jgi:hypothetical protein
MGAPENAPRPKSSLCLLDRVLDLHPNERTDVSRQPNTRRNDAARLFSLAPLALAAMLAAAPAGAFEIPTGNADLSVRWDNTIRGNYAQRVENRDPKIANAAISGVRIADEGDFLFDKGDAVAERIDLLSELDVIFQKRYGFRVSGAAWKDWAYGDSGKSNPNPPVGLPSYNNNQFTPTIKRLYKQSGELLDAFVFAGGEIGDVPVNGKLGRHALYWGESIYLGGHMHSVSYAQVPLDLQKGFATPGSEVKELFRPLNQLSGQAQLTNELSVAGQYLLDWESARYPEGGTYLGPVDFVFNGPNGFFVQKAGTNVIGYTRGAALQPKQRGEFGLSARWTPQWLDGTMGFYYRDFADKLPQVLVTKRTLLTPPGVPLASGSEYNMVYADHIQMLGASIARNIGPLSTSAEISYRKNTPLNAAVLGYAPGVPSQGDTNGPRGNTWHGLFNALGTISKTEVFDAATFGVEVQWMHLADVTSGANLFNGLGYAPCNAAGAAPAKTKWDGCSTTNYIGTSLAFTPTWFHVLPGVDLSAPMSYAVGLSGNSATVFGGNQGLGNYTVGLAADWQQKYRFDLKYVDFLGAYKDNGTAVTSTNGLTTYLKDRGFVSLTFKTTF